jgi:hypothetical protein
VTRQRDNDRLQRIRPSLNGRRLETQFFCDREFFDRSHNDLFDRLRRRRDLLRLHERNRFVGFDRHGFGDSSGGFLDRGR